MTDLHISPLIGDAKGCQYLWQEVKQMQKVLLKIGMPLFALALITGCGANDKKDMENNDNNNQNEPMEQDGNNVDENDDITNPEGDNPGTDELDEDIEDEDINKKEDNATNNNGPDVNDSSDSTGEETND